MREQCCRLSGGSRLIQPRSRGQILSRAKQFLTALYRDTAFLTQTTLLFTALSGDPLCTKKKRFVDRLGTLLNVNVRDVWISC